MLRTLRRLLRRFADPAQLALPLETPPRTAEELHERLRRHGLRRIDRCRLTRNRAVMVSHRDGELRVHEGYLAAPPDVLRAIVTFVEGRSRAERLRAREVIVGHELSACWHPPASRRERTRADDAELAARCAEWHRVYNARHFEGTLRPVAIRISRRMRSRLGHYSAATPGGEPAEIAIAWRHIRRHGWGEALHTLLHEMVHQWQDETERPIDHGRAFRAKARDVGITPAARRAVAGTRTRHGTVRVQAARRATATDEHGGTRIGNGGIPW